MPFNWDYTISEIDALVDSYIDSSIANTKTILVENSNYKKVISCLNEDLIQYSYISSIIGVYSLINQSKISELLVINKKLKSYVDKSNSNIRIFNIVNNIYKNNNLNNDEKEFIRRIIIGFKKNGISAKNGRHLNNSINEIIRNVNNIKTNKEAISYFKKVVKLKDEYAKLHNFNDYSSMINSENMSTNTDNINKFLYALLQIIKGKYHNEHLLLIESNDYKPLDNTNVEVLINNYKEKFCENIKVNFEDYFETNRTINQIIGIFSNLFQVSITFKVMKNDIAQYSVYKNKVLIGEIYIRLNSKKPGCFLIPKFNDVATSILFKDFKNKMKITDMANFFYEFTFCLQHIVCESKYYQLNVLYCPIDFTKILAFTMECVFWSPVIITALSSNINTKEKLTSEQVADIIKIRDLFIGFEIKKRITLSFYDQIIHCRDFASNIDSENIIEVVFEKINTMISPEIINKDKILYPGTKISDIFGSGGVYYNTLWNKVLAAELYSKASSKNVDYFKKLIHMVNNTYDPISLCKEIGIINEDNIPEINGFASMYNLYNEKVDYDTEYDTYYTDAKN